MTKPFDPDDQTSPTYYLTWWWKQRGVRGSDPIADFSLPADPLFHDFVRQYLDREPDPVLWPGANEKYTTQLVAAAAMWRYLFMRHHEGKRLFTVMKEDE